MQTSDYIAVASGVLSLVAIIVSGLVARSQNALSRREQLYPFLSEVLEDFHTPEFKMLLNNLRTTLAIDCPQPEHGFISLDKEARDRLRPLMSYFNEVGLLVANRAVTPQLVSSMMGGSVAESWEILAPYIYARRAERGNDPNYYAYFEHLAACVRDMGPARLEGELRLKRLPPERA